MTTEAARKETTTMDPNATLQRLVDALNAGDTKEAIEAIDDLLGWYAADGFMPTLDHDIFATLLEHTRNDLEDRLGVSLVAQAVRYRQERKRAT